MRLPKLSRLLPLLLLALVMSSATAQPAPAGAVPGLRGVTLEGRPFDLKDLRGKVALVFFWSTECAVCRDKMPELRANVQGWRNQPFEVVTVSEDRKRQNLVDYERLVAGTVVANQRFMTLWAGDPGFKDSFGKRARLPETFILDKSGKIAAHFIGRIPPEAWDTIADLL